MKSLFKSLNHKKHLAIQSLLWQVYSIVTLHVTDMGFSELALENMEKNTPGIYGMGKTRKKDPVSHWFPYLRPSVLLTKVHHGANAKGLRAVPGIFHMRGLGPGAPLMDSWQRSGHPTAQWQDHLQLRRLVQDG